MFDLSKIATRAQIPPFYAMQSLSDAETLARQGRDIVHISLGQPSARAPQVVLDEAAKLVREAPLGYTESTGIMPLRERGRRRVFPGRSRYGPVICS